MNYNCPENFGSRYTSIRNRIGSDERGERSKGDIVSDITSSFVVLLGIFFPSVTGTRTLTNTMTIVVNYGNIMCLSLIHI